MGGRRIRVSWSKKSGRGGDAGGGGGATGGKDCFNCGKPGHMSRECEEPKKSGGGGGGGRNCFNCDRPESAKSQRNPESLVVAVAVAVAETASTVASPDTCPGSARNPRSLERPGDLEADQVGATESAPEE